MNPHDPSTAAPPEPAPGPGRSDFDLYVLWKARGSHWLEYASEFAGTALLVFAVVGFVALMFSAISPLHRILPSESLRLLCTGLLIGTTGSLFTILPPGRLSGAHLNPAISVGFALLGKMHPRDLAGYIVAQLIGGIIGAVIAASIFGIAAGQVRCAALIPAPSYSIAFNFFAEFIATLAYCYGIFTSVSNEKTLRWTPLFNILLAGSLVCADGAISGAGMNPARWIGPAADTHIWAYGWLYVAAPLLAAFVAVVLRRRLPALGNAMPHTAKLFHDERYRSLFRHDMAPSSPPKATYS